jgi:hypothetical protein
VLAGERPRPPRLVVVIGEAHLSARHLPRELASRWPVAAGALRVVHDVEDLPRDGHAEWVEAASGGWLHRRLRPRRARLPALERIYRRWAEDPMAPTEIDVAMMTDGLIEAELRAVGIEPRRRRVEPGRWLPDIYPEVFPTSEPRRASRRLREEGWTRARARRALEEATERGALLLPQAGVLLVSGPSVRGLALETGRFGALALRPDGGPRAEVSFWERLATAALGFVLARAVDPTVPAAGPREVIVAADRRRQLAPALGSWLGEALERAHREGEIATGTLRRWLAGPLGGSEGAVRWLRRAVRSLGRARV